MPCYYKTKVKLQLEKELKFLYMLYEQFQIMSAANYAECFCT
jgi:hypothetical protein